MAINILSIPAMPAEAEDVFSGARRAISWERSRLGAVVVEQTECSKSWIQEVVKEGGFSQPNAAVVEVISLVEQSFSESFDTGESFR